LILSLSNLIKEREMLASTKPLKSWIEHNYRPYPSMTELEIKNEVAETLQCGIATLYRWLKDGNVYIEDVGASIAGDDGGIIVWKMQKSVFE
jgi:hypothetical protein